jgi:hypothetical protein
MKKMATVIVEGIFMGSNLKETEFEGRRNVSLYIDVYQPQSNSNEKTVQLKSDDVTLYDDLTKNFTMGNPFKAYAQVNAYKNKAYFKLLQIVNDSK